ncbi:MAG TPA: restriction endonuclease subunit S [Phycisphaerales bacterium]|jgi:type I restriction enzyme S subunit|nr:restriction endonuclease subunit S [Phycisphaerales bacterium]
MSTSAVPSDWQIANLEACVDILDSQRVPVNNKERQVRIQNKAPDELHPYYGATGEVGKIDGYLFDEELVALGEDGVPFLDPRKPKAYILSGKTWVNNHAHVLKAIEGLTTNRFLLHYLNQFDYQEYVNGGTRLKLTQANMRRMPIPVPPLAEQKVIADKLDTLLAQVENTKARLERIPPILKRFRQSVLAAAVSGRLTEEWREHNSSQFPYKNRKLSEIIHEMRNGLSPKPNEDGRGHPILRISSVRPFSLDQIDIRHLEVSEKDKERYSLQPDDLLFTRYNGSIEFVGVCARVSQLNHDTLLYPDKLIRVRVDKAQVIPEFLEIFAASLEAREYIYSLVKSTSGQKGISGKDLKLMKVALPTVSEQTEIVHQVDQLFAHADRIEQQVNNALARVNNLTQSILAKAFRGELTEQWRRDNPELIGGENSAEALLERIKAERAAMKPVKRTRNKRTTV